jgi:hypothetical protein
MIYGTQPNKALQLPSANSISLHRRCGSFRSPAALAVWRRDVVMYHRSQRARS